MSHTEFTCPQCGKPFEIEFFHSVNSETQPELFAKAAEGPLFHFKCPHCGKETVCFYPILVEVMKPFPCFVRMMKDPKKGAADATELRSNLTPEQAALIKNKGPRRLRFVGNFFDMQEKIQLFQEGLDDRTVETLKLMIFGAMELLDKGADAFRYYKVDGNESLVATKGKEIVTVLPFDRKSYESFDEINRSKDPHWDEDDSTAYIVDADWAENWFEKHL